ncbi:hypothetical protein KEC55_30645 [Burkholderia cepacia]|uniref:hypothetical protein n=1 Tax=Burkholderia cepacia TaxID=292 RepID=UPI00249F1672|nr:hypothetical protein [Burkholderia cepacia]WGY71350.1 hypothetical protein KEC55_30645 [Burkholderia cepacia]
MRTRAVLVYTYNENGAFSEEGQPVISDVIFNGMRAWLTGSGFPLRGTGYYGGKSPNWWGTKEPLVATVSVRISNKKIADWPAIGILAAQYGGGNPGDYYEKSGMAYIRVGESRGACSIVANPDLPTPLDIAVDMTAPDWSLGELSRGESEKTFPEISNQLCFTYSGRAVKGKKFVIDASNANGIVANRYLLKNVSEATQVIPYSVTLDSGTSTLSLPNASNAGLSFDSSGKTCFVPTFKTSVDAKVKEGDYIDVLVFTVVVKP